MKTRHVILAMALILALSGKARSQTTTDCTKTSDTTMSCTTTQPPAATPPQPSAIDQFNKAIADAKASRQAAQAAQQQAEAGCVSGGGTFYEGHCLTQQQYDAQRRQEADWVAQQQAIKAQQQASKEQARIAKLQAEDARDAKKYAEKQAKEAKKQAEKEAKAAKNSQPVASAQ
jgi:hypothetical protein